MNPGSIIARLPISVAPVVVVRILLMLVPSSAITGVLVAQLAVPLPARPRSV